MQFVEFKKVMSKLYDKYENLKSKEVDCLYLFLCGNFYIALDSDAIILNELFDMKLTKFSNLCDKCGFPKNSLEKYNSKLNDNNIKYKIINEISVDSKLERIKSLVNDIDIKSKDKEQLVNIVEEIQAISLE